MRQYICLRSDSDCLSNPEDIANFFASLFSGCFSSDAPKDRAFLCDLVCSDIRAVNKVMICEIMAAIKKLMPKLTSGTDYVINFISKGCSNLLAPIVKHTFDISLSKGIFSPMWKESILFL